MRARRLLRHWLDSPFGVLLLYTALALVLTWPLAAHFTTHVPGDGIDDPALAWNLWWIKARLVDQHNPDIFHADWMFHPIDINLGFYTLTPLNGLLSIPLQTALGLIAATNLLLLSSFVLGGFGMYLLSRDLLAQQPLSGASDPVTVQPTAIGRRPWLGQHWTPAVFSGVVYAFASAKLFYASLGQFNIASSHWIPFCVLYVLRAGRSPDARSAARYALLAGLFLVFQAWAELTYATFLVIFIGLHFLWQWVTGILPPRRDLHGPARRRSALWLRTYPYLIMAAIFLVGLGPFLWAMLPDMAREGDFFASGGGFAGTFSADLLGYLLPTRLHPLAGGWAGGASFPNDKGQQIFVGYSAMALSAVGAVTSVRRHGRAGWFWPLATLLFWLLTLGPLLRWNGQELALAGPFALVSRLPFFSGNRYPSRYSVMLMLCVAALAGYGLQRLHLGTQARKTGDPDQRRPNRLVSVASPWFLSGVFIVVFLIEHLSVPLPLNDSRVPSIYRTIAEQPGDFAILELPTGWRNGARVLGHADELIMMQQWYQAVHGKRRLGGNTSRNPLYKFQYFTQAPLVGDLIALMNRDELGHIAPKVVADWDALVARSRAAAPEVLNFLGVEFVTLHVERAGPYLRRFVDEALPVTLVAEWNGPDWAGQLSTIRLYQVEVPATHGAWSTDLGQPAGRLYLAEGWSTLGAHGGQVRYATRPQASLLLDLPADGGILALELFGPASQVVLNLNGRPLATVRTGEAMVEVSVPPGVADRLVDRLTFDFGPALYPSAAAASPLEHGWTIGDTGARLPPERSIVVVSAGNEVGDFARIYVSGVDVTRQEGEDRGYHLAALDPAGQLLESAVFDTHARPEQSTALAAWLHQWPEGTIVAGAVADEASHHLGAEAVAALADLGVVADLREHFRWSHAFVGVAGTPPGSALETMDLWQPAIVFVGSPVDAPFVSGGVGRITFAPSGNASSPPSRQ